MGRKYNDEFRMDLSYVSKDSQQVGTKQVTTDNIALLSPFCQVHVHARAS